MQQVERVTVVKPDVDRSNAVLPFAKLVDEAKCDLLITAKMGVYG